MEPIATGILLILGIVAVSNIAHGTFGQWVGAKFVNATDPQNLATNKASTPALGVHELVRPVPGPITSPFGAARNGHTHAGADLQAAQGDPVRAANGGIVSAQATDSGDCGGRLDITEQTDSGLMTRYCHLSGFEVHQGDHVTQGQTIGRVGGQPGTVGAGDATGPHLHFEVRVHGVAEDPATWIGG